MNCPACGEPDMLLWEGEDNEPDWYQCFKCLHEIDFDPDEPFDEAVE